MSKGFTNQKTSPIHFHREKMFFVHTRPTNRLEMSPKVHFRDLGFYLQSAINGGVLWFSDVSHGHLGRVYNRFCAGLTTFWWILSEKSGFESTLKTSHF